MVLIQGEVRQAGGGGASARREPSAMLSSVKAQHVHQLDDAEQLEDVVWFDMNFSKWDVKVTPADPDKVEKMIKSMRKYVDFAKNFTTDTQVAAFGLAGPKTEAKHRMEVAFVGLEQEATLFESLFGQTLGDVLDLLPPAMQAMAQRQVPRVKSAMHDVVSPFGRIREAAEDNGLGSISCPVVSAAIDDMERNSRVFVHLNRQQAMGSKAMLKSMPETWKAKVNTSLISEMGSMAQQTADNVERATQNVAHAVGIFMQTDVQCVAPAPPQSAQSASARSGPLVAMVVLSWALGSWRMYAP